MFVDFVLNGEAHGAVAEHMHNYRFDPGYLRPYLDERGEKCVTVNSQKQRFDEKLGIMRPVPVKVRVKELIANGVNNPLYAANAATMRKDEWIQLDRAVVEATLSRLTLWGDMVAKVAVGGFNAMGKLTYEYEAESDSGEAIVDMEAMTPGRHDESLYKLRSIPLPVTHSDFNFSERRLMASRNSGAGLDVSGARRAGRRVAETIEKTAIGTVTGMTFGTNSTNHDGTSTVYGATNFPYRIVITLTTPTGSNPEAINTDVLEMIELMQAAGFYGPYTLYHSTGYSRYLNEDYYRSGSTSAVRSVRARIMENEGITAIKRLDNLTSGYQMILVQMDPECVQAINGMDITTVQWPEMGGMRQCFKVMAIQVPLWKAPYNGVAGVCHGTA